MCGRPYWCFGDGACSCVPDVAPGPDVPPAPATVLCVPHKQQRPVTETQHEHDKEQMSSRTASPRSQSGLATCPRRVLCGERTRVPLCVPVALVCFGRSSLFGLSLQRRGSGVSRSPAPCSVSAPCGRRNTRHGPEVVLPQFGRPGVQKPRAGQGRCPQPLPAASSPGPLMCLQRHPSLAVGRTPHPGWSC